MAIMIIHFDENRLLLKADDKPLMHTASSHTSALHVEVPVVDKAIVTQERGKEAATPEHQASVPVATSNEAARHTEAAASWHRVRDHEQDARSWNYELGEFNKAEPPQS